MKKSIVCFAGLMILLLSSVFSSAQCVSGDCQNGQGVYKFKSGDRFEGSFKNGLMAKGSLFYTNGDRYQGYFANNKRQGQGKYIYKKTGNVFEGIFSEGQKTNGTFVYADGSSYTGNFQNNKKNGKGILKTKDGKLYDGYWENDMFVGASQGNSVNTFALIVGVADYKYAGPTNGDLRFTVNDARLFYDFLTTKSGGTVPEENVRLLLNEQASQSNIVSNAKSLFTRADANDRIIFFFSGHGSPGCFIPYDADKSGDNLLSHNQVKELFRMSKAAVKLVFADACFSGSIKKFIPEIGKKAFPDESAAKAPPSSVKEVAIMMSSDKDQISFEYPGLNQGVFSYYLIGGLRGAADKNNDNTISMAELYYYVRDNTYSYVKTKINKRQTPILFGNFDREMIIASY